MKSSNSEQRQMKIEFEKLYGAKGEMYRLLTEPSKYSQGALLSFFERAASSDKTAFIDMLSKLGGPLSNHFKDQHNPIQNLTAVPFTATKEAFQLITFLVKTHSFCTDLENRQIITELIRARKKNLIGIISSSSSYPAEQKLDDQKKEQIEHENLIELTKKTFSATIAKLEILQIKQQSIDRANAETRNRLAKKLKITRANLTRQKSSLAGLKTALKSVPPSTYEETYAINKRVETPEKTIARIEKSMADQQKIIDTLEREIKQTELRLAEIDKVPSETRLDIESQLSNQLDLTEQHLLTQLSIEGLIAIYQNNPITPIGSPLAKRQLVLFQTLWNALKKHGTNLNDFASFLSTMTPNEHSEFFNNTLSLDRNLDNFKVKSLLAHEVNLMDLVRLTNKQLSHIKSSSEQVMDILKLGVSFHTLCHHRQFAHLEGILKKNDEIQFLLDRQKHKKNTWKKVIFTLHIPPHYLLLLQKNELFTFFKFVGKHSLEALETQAKAQSQSVYEYLFKNIMDTAVFNAMVEEIQQRLAQGVEEHEPSEKTIQSSSPSHDSQVAEQSLSAEGPLLGQESIELARRFTFFPKHPSLSQEAPKANISPSKTRGQ